MNRRLWVCCVMFCLVVAGCGSGQPVVPSTAAPTSPATQTSSGPRLDVTPTPLKLTSTPSLTLTVTPIPTAAATSTPAPPEPLRVAVRHMQNANYRAAAAVYEQILAEGPDALHPDAAFGLGEVAARQGLHTEAIEQLTAFLDDHARTAPIEQRAWAHFLRADAYYALGEGEEAMVDYRRYLALRPGVIDSYVYGRIAIIQADLAQWDEMLASYLAALEAGREPEGMRQLREDIAALYKVREDWESAAAQYERILETLRDSEARAGVIWQLAEARLAQSRTEEANALLRRLVTSYPDTTQAYDAMLALINAGQPTSAYQRGLVSFFNEDYRGARDAFYAHLASLLEGKGPALLWMYIGLAQRALGDYAAAGDAFQQVIDLHPDDPLASQAMLMQGRVYFEAGSFTAAVGRYIEVAEAYSASPEAPEALWRAAYLYETALEDTERALATYEILGATHAGTERAQNGLWRAAALARALSDNGRAERLLAMLAESGAGEMAAKGALWLGKLRAERGDDAAGVRTVWEMGAEMAPYDYYGIRCADHVAGREPFAAPAVYRFEFDEGRDVPEAEAWLRETFVLGAEAPADGPLWPLDAALALDARLVRGEELWRLGWFDPARAEFTALRQTYASDPVGTYRLAVHFRNAGVHRPSVEAAATLINMARAQTLEVPPFIARMRFPTPYADLVLPSAEMNGVDPLFVYSVMRQESLFDGLATSHAYAYGLMQIIEDTGAHIAGQLNWADFTVEQLYRPHVSVTFGVFHIGDLFDIFGGDPYAVLSAYNAGPGNASRWLDQSGGDHDLYIEVVDFEETELYITIITENYAMYRALYGAE